MPTDPNHIGAFLSSYGRALSAGDLPAIVACWDIPPWCSTTRAAARCPPGRGRGLLCGCRGLYQAQGLLATRPRPGP